MEGERKKKNKQGRLIWGTRDSLQGGGCEIFRMCLKSIYIDKDLELEVGQQKLLGKHLLLCAAP